MQKMKEQWQKREEMKAKGHGSYEEVTEEDFLKSVTGSEYVICHFYKEQFTMCKLADKHLNIIANKHFETRFIKLDAEKAPFFVTKLIVRILPTLICFKAGVAFYRLEGFDSFSDVAEFKTEELEKKLGQEGAIQITDDLMNQEFHAEGTERKSVFGFVESNDNDDDDF
jgi:thioredoxin-like negative regulator of GroEL